MFQSSYQEQILTQCQLQLERLPWISTFLSWIIHSQHLFGPEAVIIAQLSVSCKIAAQVLVTTPSIFLVQFALKNVIH